MSHNNLSIKKNAQEVLISQHFSHRMFLFGLLFLQKYLIYSIFSKTPAQNSQVMNTLLIR